MNFLVFDGSKAINEARGATAKATAAAKAGGVPFSRITLNNQLPSTGANKVKYLKANTPAAKAVRKARAAGTGLTYNRRLMRALGAKR